MKTILVFLLAVALTLGRSCAENWTVNGKTFVNVKVGQIEPDRVHISYDGGIGTVNLSDLAPDIQKRLNYDPTKAKAMSQQRDADQQAADVAEAKFAAQNQQLQVRDAQEAQEAVAVDQLFTEWEAAIVATHQSWQERGFRDPLLASMTAPDQNRLTQVKTFLSSPLAANYTLDEKTKLINAVRTQTVFIGMSRNFVLISKGQPSITNAAGAVEQLIFGSAEAGRQYVNIENGAVTAFRTDPPSATYLPSGYAQGYSTQNADLGQ